MAGPVVPTRLPETTTPEEEPWYIRYARRMQPENRSVTDPWYVRGGQVLSDLVGGTDPTSAMGLAGTLNVPRRLPVRVANPLKAYHASPHDFERFDISKVGAGEGGQMYSHGLYFAENPAVSGRGGQYDLQFTRKLRDQPVTYQGQTYTARAPEHLLLRRASEYGKEAAIQDIEQELRSNLRYRVRGEPFEARYEPLAADREEKLRRQLNWLRSVDPQDIPPKAQARIYEVDLHADPQQMLQWHTPLQEQTPYVQKVLRDLELLPDRPAPQLWQPHLVTEADLHSGVFGRNVSAGRLGLSMQPGQWITVLRDELGNIQNYHAVPHPDRQHALSSAKSLNRGLAELSAETGEEAYTQLVSQMGGRAAHKEGKASQTLREAGIPGVRYPDAGSRFDPRGRAYDVETMKARIKYLEEQIGRQEQIGLEATAAPGNRPDGVLDVGRLQEGLQRASHVGTLRDRLAADQAQLQELLKPPTQNYVLYDDRLIDIRKKYAALLALMGGGAAAAHQRIEQQGAPPTGLSGLTRPVASHTPVGQPPPR
jgi:hypothetical protein